MSKALLYSDKISNFAELAAAAKHIGKEAIAFVIGSASDASEVSKYVSKVIHAEQNDKMAEAFFDSLKVAAADADVVLIGSTKRGKYMAGRLAATCGTSALTDLSNMEVDGSGIKGTRMYYAGVALSTVKSKGKAVVILPAGAFDAVAAGANGEVTVAEAGGVSNLVRTEVRKKEGESVNLAAAKKVVGVGRGFGKQEDLALAEAFAKALGAEVGCSRPIAEGEGWMSTDRYIGVSGVMLKPDVYVAVGISGQIQHTIGINSSKIIIAINKDKNAPIFKQCDYGIVGDLTKILPELTRLFSN